MNFVAHNWFNILSAISILANLFLAVYFGIKSWSKPRAIYEIKRKIIRQVRGRQDDLVIQRNLEEINKLLNTGKWSIISISTRKADGDFEMLLGRIKK